MTKKFNYTLFFVCLPIVLVVGFVVGAFSYLIINKQTGSDKLLSSDVQIVFFELGNDKAGDSFLIKCGDVEVLVDAGSDASSVPTIVNSLNNYVKDGVIEYAIITHAHTDHYAGFCGSSTQKSLFTYYKFEKIIDFSNTNKAETASEYSRYLAERNAEVKEGAEHHNVLDCYNNVNGAKRKYEIGYNVNIEFLYHKFYEEKSDTENNYSVSFLLTQGDKNFLFTGDLEEVGEQSLVENNNLPEVEVFKAGHHGSKTSSHMPLLNAIKPKNVVVTCVAGSVEYTQIKNNTFPTQDFINRVANFTENVYVTSVAVVEEVDDGKGGTKFVNLSHSSLNGIIVVNSTKEETKITGTNSNTILKNTSWFKENRTWPSVA